MRYLSTICLDRISLFFILSSFICVGHSDEVVFFELIEKTTGREILEWRGEGEENLKEACFDAVLTFNQAHYADKKPSELGVVLEKHVLSSFLELGYDCSIPVSQNGVKKHVGYPDLVYKTDGKVFYIELKLYHTEVKNSHLRTFYYSETKDTKVTEDAYHVLIGFEYHRNLQSSFRINSFECIDLRYLPCKVKTEYNASNNILYGGDYGWKLSCHLENFK